MLVTCASCGRRRTIEKRPRGRLRCSNCGAFAVRVQRKLKWWMATADFDGIPEHDARTLTFARLAWYAEQKGYKPGYASAEFKAIYGCWPNGESKAVPQVVVAPLMHWINLQNAAFAAAKRRERIEKENES